MLTAHPQLDTLAADYLATLMAGDRSAALHLAREALAVGTPLEDIYQDVLQPALYAIGRLWARGELGVANEHIATAITRSVMEMCARMIKPIPPGPPRVIATCVGPELHDIGLRMVADVLELHGWHTLYLGANIPLDAVVALAVHHRIEVVAASITIGSHARELRDLINALRLSPIGGSLKILVGGQPFQRVPELWRQVQADGTAGDAREAAAWVRARLHPGGGPNDER